MKIRNALLNGPLGFGAAPLGNMFRNIPDSEAAATVDTAWEQGTRYFDTAPFYGAGLSEIRLGKELSRRRRSEAVRVEPAAQGWIARLRVARLVRTIQAVPVVLKIDSGRIVAVDDENRKSGGGFLNHGQLPISQDRVYCAVP